LIQRLSSIRYPPTRGAAGKNFVVTFNGLQISPYVVVAFSAPGQCNSSTARVWSGTLSTSLSSVIRIADAGFFSVCVSLNGPDQEFVEQRNIKMTIMGLASSTSITHIDPDRTAVGRPTLISLSGLVFYSEFTFVAFTNATCSDVSEESLLALNETLKVRATFQVDGTHRVCLSTSGKNTSALVYQPLVSLAVISSASQAPITGIYPTTVPVGMELNFSISSDAPLWSSFSYAGLVLDGRCSESSAELYTHLRDSNTFFQQLHTIGIYRLCYAQSSNGPFVMYPEAEVLAFAAASSESITWLQPSRVTKGVQTRVMIEGAVPSMVTWIKFSTEPACNDTFVGWHQAAALATATEAWVHIPTNVAASEFTICYSTRGPDGPYVTQTSVNLHAVTPASVNSISSIVPNRIAAEHPTSITFHGADFSPLTFIAISPVGSAGNCSSVHVSVFHKCDTFCPSKCIELCVTKALGNFTKYTLCVAGCGLDAGQTSSLVPSASDDLSSIHALQFGAGSQTNPVKLEFRDAGTYQICYSTNYTGAGTPFWETQGKTIEVIEAASSKTVKELVICNENITGADITKLCTRGTRIHVPHGTLLSYLFVGADHSASTVVAFSRYVHPWLGRPDCSKGRVFETPLGSGTGNQASAASLQLDVPPGEYHVCVSTHGGADGSWWPRTGGLRQISSGQAVFVSVLARVTNRSIAALTPEGGETLQLISVQFQGEYSVFSRIGLALSGFCNIQREVTLWINNSNSVQFQAPRTGNYKICYQHVGQSVFQEQVGVAFTSFDAASNSSISEMQTFYTAQVGEFIFLSAGHPEHVRFVGAAYAEAVRIGFSKVECPSGCADVCIQREVPVMSGSTNFPNSTEVSLSSSGDYNVCYKTYRTWERQINLTVRVIPRETENSISMLICSPATCGAVRANVTSNVSFIGSVYSPNTAVGFTTSKDCTDMVFHIPLNQHLSAALIFSLPTIYYVCYTTSYRLQAPHSPVWLLQPSVIAVQVVPSWHSVLGLERRASGGNDLLFVGAGFRPSQKLSCLLTAGNTSFISAGTVVSESILSCVQPRWAATSSMVSVELHLEGVGRLPDRQPLWLLPVATSVNPACGSRFGGTEVFIHGDGFGGLVVHTDNDEKSCVHKHKSDCSKAWETAISLGLQPMPPIVIACLFTGGNLSMQVEARRLSPLLASCRTPQWSDESWYDYDEGTQGWTNLTLLAAVNRSCNPLDLNLTSQLNLEWIPISCPQQYRFRKVNHAPGFVGANVNVLQLSRHDNGSFIVPNWTRAIYKGVREDKSIAWDEDAQLVSFEVRALVPSYFRLQPQLSGDGTLTFTPADFKAGRTSIEVVAKDDGGTNCGGRDMSRPKRFSITLTVTDADPEYLIQDRIVVPRNFVAGQGLVIVEHFLSLMNLDIASPSMDFLATDLHFETEAFVPHNFLVKPSIYGEGTLSFEPAVGFYGNNTVRFRFKLRNGALSAWKNFTIEVEYINYKPSFEIPMVLELLEDTPAIVIERFAFNISRGLFPEAFELGQYHSDSLFRSSEAWQTLSFTVIPVDADRGLFVVQPFIAPNGTLAFTLAEHSNGNATYSVFLTDSGGSLDDSKDTSSILNFSFVVIPVNDPPAFNMTPEHAVFENPADLLVSVQSFVKYGKWVDLFQGPADEAIQNVTFELVYVSGNTTLFTQGPEISPAGTLQYSVGAYRWGKTTFNVTLHDSGGNSHGGMSSAKNIRFPQTLTIDVKPLNTDPTLGMPAEIWLWTNYVATLREPYMMVRDRCCSPCPGPMQPGHSCTLGQCCSAASADGSFDTLASRANASAGPWEDMQNITFHIAVNDHLLFSALRAPEISFDGTIDFNVNTFSNGSAVMNITLQDSDGGRIQQEVNLTVLAGHVDSALYIENVTMLTSLQVREIAAAAAQVETWKVILGDPTGVSSEPCGKSLSCGGSCCGVSCSHCQRRCVQSFGSDAAQFAQCMSNSNCSRVLNVFGNTSNPNKTNGTGISVAGTNLNPGPSTWDKSYAQFQILGNTIEDLLRSERNLRSLFSSEPRIFARSGNGEQAIWFNMPDAVDMHEEKQQEVPLQNIFVDKSRFSLTGVQYLSMSARIVKYMIPGRGHTDWINATSDGNQGAVCVTANAHCVESHGFEGCEPCLFGSAPTVHLDCHPYCTTGKLILEATFVPGLAVIEVILQQASPWNCTFSREIVVSVPSVPSAPRVQAKYSKNLTLLEDGGPCFVDECRIIPVIMRVTEIFFDGDMWLPGNNIVMVNSSNTTMLECTIIPINNTLILKRGLHRHGFINLTAIDSTGLRSDPPLIVWLKHVNHPPYLVTKSGSKLRLNYSEDQVITEPINLYEYIYDVDMVDQNDPHAEVDSLHFIVESENPDILEVQVDRHLVRLTFRENQNGLVRLHVTARDLADASASTIIEINVASVPDPPFSQYKLHQEDWRSQSSPGKYCDDGQGPRDQTVVAFEGVDKYSVSMEQCWLACAQDIECVAVTFQTTDIRCRKAIKQCTMRSSGAHSTVYMRPPGIILREGGVEQINISTLFGDVDNCWTLLHGKPCTNESDIITVLSQSSDESRLKATINASILMLQAIGNMHTCQSPIFWECDNRYANSPLVVTLVAVDLHNLNASFTLNITILSENNSPTATLPTLILTEGVGTNITIHHTSNASGAGWKIIDPDLSTNVASDSLKLMASASDNRLFDVVVMTVANGGNTTQGSLCSFPFTFNGVEYNNCTASMDREQPWCVTSVVTRAWGYCQHVLRVSLVAGQFGRASLLLEAQDSYGGHLQTSAHVVVQMVNDAPFIQLPAILTTFQSLGFGQQEYYPAFVTILSLGIPQCQGLSNNNGLVCCVDQISENASFLTACPLTTRPEDHCQRVPARMTGDCWGPDSLGQNITFQVDVAHGNKAIFWLPPQISPTGDLTFELRPELSGEVNLTITVMDDGGNEHGGVSNSSHLLNLKVLPLPVFSVFNTLVVPENVNSGTISSHYPDLNPAWATSLRNWSQDGFAFDIAPGSGYPANQALTFIVSQVSGDVDLFVNTPCIDYRRGQGQGTLLFSQMPDRHGIATFQVQLKDGVFNPSDNKLLKEVFFTIIVEQINNPPTFCVSAPLNLLEDYRYENYTFANVSTGGSYCLNNADSCGGICGHVAAYGKELNQAVTFEVSTAGPACSPFECFDDEIGMRFESLSWMRVDKRGNLFVRACNRGQIYVNITLRDDGGTYKGGVDISEQMLLVIVEPVNDMPHFDFSRGNTIFLLEGSKDPFPLAVNITGGRCEKDQVEFTLDQILFCIPDCHDASLSASPQDILFESLTLLSNGTLRYVLNGFRNGRVIWTVALTDGDLTVYKNLTVYVLPVNSPPLYDLGSGYGLPTVADRQELAAKTGFTALGAPPFFTLSFTEDLIPATLRDLFINIVAGGWNENEQNIRVVFKMISGSPLMQCIEVTCEQKSNPTACNESSIILVDGDVATVKFEGPMHRCSRGKADLWAWSGPGRFGKQLFDVMFQDNGGLEEADNLSYGRLSAPLPENSRNFFAIINVQDDNDAPSFEIPSNVAVLQDSSCMSSAIFWQGFSSAKCDRTCRRCRRHVRAGFASQISLGDSYETGTADICRTQPSACDRQVASFTVTTLDESKAADIFARRPEVSWNGTLSFTLNEFKFGSATFVVFLKDSGGRESIHREFAIQVDNVNDAPSFNVPERIVGFESIPFANVAVFRVSEGQFEEFQEVSFSIQIDNPDLFSELPSIQRKGAFGILKFEPRLDVFGATVANITIVDDGGTDWGGLDSSTVKTLIEIFPVNHPPTVVFSDDVFVFEDPEPQSVQGLTADMRAGPDNENGACSTLPGDCQSQVLDFNLVSVSNPKLFAMLPRLDQSGTLTFQLCKDCSGVSSVCFTAQDNAGILSDTNFPACAPCQANLTQDARCCRAPTIPRGDDLSSRFCSVIHAEPVDTAPNFRLSWDVTCTRLGLECSCLDAVTALARSNYTQSQACQPTSPAHPLASIRVLEDADTQRIQNFASGISTANGYVKASDILFSGNVNNAGTLENGDVIFMGTNPDPVSSQEGLEMTTDYETTFDGFVAVAEAENDAVSLWSQSAQGALIFVDRRTSGENRLRFKGFIQPSSHATMDPNSAQFGGRPRSLSDATAVCGMQKLQIDDQRLVLTASGCEHIWNDSNFLYNSTHLQDSEWASVIGHWDFDSASVYNSESLGSMRVNKFNQDLANGIKQRVACDGHFCTYTRHKLPGCAEKFATNIGPATFRDKSNVLGAAVLAGMHLYCKFSTEWDASAEGGLSALNFVASADGIEAVSVDGTVNLGLFVTDDIDELVDGNPLTSRLPIREMSVEVLFATGEPGTTVHPLLSTAQNLICANPRAPRDCGCQKGWTTGWRFSGEDRRLSLSLSISVSENAKNPDYYGSVDKYDTTTGKSALGIGPGLGKLYNVEWIAPAGFAEPGDWVHLIATYDGKEVSIYVNGTLRKKESVCNKPACGDIIYAASYHTCPGYCPCPPLPGGEEGETVPPGTPCGSNTRFRGCIQGQDAPPGRKTPVVIGWQPDILSAVYVSHVGLIKHARIYKKSVSAEYVRGRAKEFSMLQGKFPLHFDSYWYNSNGQSNPDYPACEPKAPEMSPSVTFVDLSRVRLSSNAQDRITFLGLFDEGRKYKARFTQRDSRKPFVEEAKFLEVNCQILDPSLSKLRFTGLVGKSSELRCEMPRDWPYSYHAAVVSIMEQQTDGQEFRFVWSRACFRSECGYSEIGSALRGYSESRWIVRTECCNTPADVPCEGSLQLSNSVSGIPTRIRLLTQSTLMELEEAAGTLALRYPVEHWKVSAVSLTRSDSFLRSGIFESRTHPFASVSQLAVLGASSIAILESSGILYLLVANFWDGASLTVQSTVLRVDDLGQGTMTLVQGFETKGARKFHSFQVRGQTYVALANFAENSAVFKWRPGTPISKFTIVDPGLGYVDGRIMLRCLRPAQYCSGNGKFSAEFRVDGPAHRDGTVGRIVDVFQHIDNVGDDYLADHDVVLAYLHDNKTMDQTISAIRFAEPLQLTCSRLVDIFVASGWLHS
jgi:hypothetical protein